MYVNGQDVNEGVLKNVVFQWIFITNNSYTMFYS